MVSAPMSSGYREGGGNPYRLAKFPGLVLPLMVIIYLDGFIVSGGDGVCLFGEDELVR